MRTIYKYTLSLDKEQTIELPANAQILTVQAQREFPQLWAIIDTDEERTEQITIIFHGTGNPIENEACSSYIGTIQLYGGRLVLHAFLKYKQ